MTGTHAHVFNRDQMVTAFATWYQQVKDNPTNFVSQKELDKLPIPEQAARSADHLIHLLNHPE